MSPDLTQGTEAKGEGRAREGKEGGEPTPSPYTYLTLTSHSPLPVPCRSLLSSPRPQLARRLHCAPDVSRDTLFGPTASILWGRLPSRTSRLREEDDGTRGEVASRFRLGSKKILRYVASTAGPWQNARAGRRPSGLRRHTRGGKLPRKPGRTVRVYRAVNRGTEGPCEQVKRWTTGRWARGVRRPVRRSSG